MISKNIKELREVFNMSQPQLAKAIGVANSTVSFWENGINEPKASYIIALAKLFDVTTDYLLGADSQA